MGLDMSEETAPQTKIGFEQIILNWNTPASGLIDDAPVTGLITTHPKKDGKFEPQTCRLAPQNFFLWAGLWDCYGVTMPQEVLQALVTLITFVQTVQPPPEIDALLPMSGNWLNRENREWTIQPGKEEQYEFLMKQLRVK